MRSLIFRQCTDLRMGVTLGVLQRGPGGPWPTQNFDWVGHNAFGPTNNWPVSSLEKLV